MKKINLDKCIRVQCRNCKHYNKCFKGEEDMLVKATEKYEELKLKDKELNRIPKKGETFEVTDERYNVLTKNNKYNAIFVEKVQEVETATIKAKTETAVRKTRKSTK